MDKELQADDVLSAEAEEVEQPADKPPSHIVIVKQAKPGEPLENPLYGWFSWERP